MTSLYVFIGITLLIGSLIVISRKWGSTNTQREQLQNTLDKVVKKKEIDNEINNLSNNDLLNRWLKWVRNHNT